MKKEMLKKLTAGIVCGIMLVLPVVSFAADGFITPWNRTYNIDGSGDSALNIVDTANWTSKNPTTYDYVSVNAGGTAVIRDSYTDAEGNTIYDNATKTQGNKYIYLTSEGKTNKKGEIFSPGTLYANCAAVLSKKLDTAGANGGICHGKVRYELDVRIGGIDPATTDYSGTGIYISGYDASAATEDNKIPTIASLSFVRPKAAGVYAIGYTPENPSGTTYIRFALDEWYHYTIDVDVEKQTASFSVNILNPDAQIASDAKKAYSGSLKLSKKGIPAFTTVKVMGIKSGATSVDNISVTKETYVIKEVKSSDITVSEDSVTATVNIANDVYADKNFGSALATASPKVILATYDTNGALIDAGIGGTDFADNILRDKGADETDSNYKNHRKAFFTKDLTYKPVTVSVQRKDGTEISSTKVFVWNNMTDMFPYTAGTDGLK